MLAPVDIDKTGACYFNNGDRYIGVVHKLMSSDKLRQRATGERELYTNNILTLLLVDSETYKFCTSCQQIVMPYVVLTVTEGNQGDSNATCLNLLSTLEIER